ncbi:MAG: GlsB/YeaQ/YmgE family stress response membrane protein [Phreatobacter sp.]
MSGQSLLVILIVGGIAGWLAGLVLRGSGYGIIGDVIVGLLGSMIGSYLVRTFHISVNVGNPWVNQGIVAFAGAVILLLVIGLLRPRTFGEHVRGWFRRR